MAYNVKARQTVTARVDVKNVGGQRGTFRLTGELLFAGTGMHAGWLTKRNKNYEPCPGGAPPEPDWNYTEISLAAGQQYQLVMYKANFACGQEVAFEDGQAFDVLWSLKCLETGEVATLIDRGQLVFRRSPPMPNITSVVASPTTVNQYSSLTVRVTFQNVGGKAAKFEVTGWIKYASPQELRGQIYRGIGDTKEVYAEPGQSVTVDLIMPSFGEDHLWGGMQFYANVSVREKLGGIYYDLADSNIITFYPAAAPQPPPSPPPPPPEPPQAGIVSVTMNRSTVTAGDLLTGTVGCLNTGGSPGRFKLTGTIYFEGGTLHGMYAGSMTQRNKNYKPCPGGADLEPDWNYIEFTLAPGERRDITMYKANFACGDPTVFDDGQRFRITWKLTCLDTGDEAIDTRYVTFRRS